MLNFSRRINGRTYYAGFALIFITVIVLELIGTFLSGVIGEDTAAASNISVVVFVLMMLLVIGYGAALVRQRANDISGSHPLLWFFLIFFTPIGVIAGFIPSEKQANRYDQVPEEKFQLTTTSQ